MKKAFVSLVFLLIVSLSIQAQTKKDGTPDMRYSANKAASGISSSTLASSTQTNLTNVIRPVYSGQKHTKTHGGFYLGSTNVHHKNGHYVSPTSQHIYRIHKTKKNSQ